EVGLLHLESLLRLDDALALSGDAPHQEAHGLLRLGQLGLLPGLPALRLFEGLARFREPRFPAEERLALLGLGAQGRVALPAHLRDRRLEPLPRIGDEADLGLEAGDVGVGAVELALRRGERVAGGVVLGARLLELALALAQARGLGLELD